MITRTTIEVVDMHRDDVYAQLDAAESRAMQEQASTVPDGSGELHLVRTVDSVRLMATRRGAVRYKGIRTIVFRTPDLDEADLVRVTETVLPLDTQQMLEREGLHRDDLH